MSHRAFTFTTQVNGEGKVELDVPLPPGTHVEVVVLSPEKDDFESLVEASNSATDFWNNPFDDEDWNNA